MDVERRTCEVSAACGAVEVNLTMHFPASYPNNLVPTFVLSRESTIDESAQSKLIKVSVLLFLRHFCIPKFLQFMFLMWLIFFVHFHVLGVFFLFCSFIMKNSSHPAFYRILVI